jgi:NTP pyrophosphatase (non-canonical NTP hydrolase)
MDLRTYQKAAIRTRKKPDTYRDGVLNWTLGLAGESGEFADLIKKGLFHGHDVTMMDLADELGDVLWYVAVLADQLGFNLNDIATLNVKKLQVRYPEGFSTEASLARVDVATSPDDMDDHWAS